MAAHPPKKQKIMQKFREDYSKEWNFITKSKLSECHARCSICDTDIKIGSGGRADLEKHIKTPKHVLWSNSLKSTPCVSSFWQKEDLDIIASQCRKIEKIL